VTGIRGEADGVVPAAEQEQVEELGIIEPRGQPPPEIVVDVRNVVEGVYGIYESLLRRVGPAPIG
jgi:hypothetical protein